MVTFTGVCFSSLIICPAREASLGLSEKEMRSNERFFREIENFSFGSLNAVRDGFLFEVRDEVNVFGFLK